MVLSQRMGAFGVQVGLQVPLGHALARLDRVVRLLAHDAPRLALLVLHAHDDRAIRHVLVGRDHDAAADEAIVADHRAGRGLGLGLKPVATAHTRRSDHAPGLEEVVASDGHRLGVAVARDEHAVFDDRAVAKHQRTGSFGMHARVGMHDRLAADGDGAAQLRLLTHGRARAHLNSHGSLLSLPISN